MIDHNRIIGSVSVNSKNITLVIEGLYRAPVSGAYSICLGGVDDGEVVYFGEGSAFAFTDALPVLNVTGPETPPMPGVRLMVFGTAVDLEAATWAVQPPGGAVTQYLTGLLYSPSCGELL
ncbi:hypothetical protein UVI_02008120 [Ustilaginoidea virens]|uniref:PA14 domain-containing protein n=1 Tax=Ustilaginoidea virens TaxID=1159556 RepID=A0A1B5L6J5_USTVR|nr:hypothetical protein UVI_02008120 [Ustilaginoidea virens]